MEVEQIKQVIEKAKASVIDLQEPLKSQAFAIVLSKLLEEVAAVGNTTIGNNANEPVKNGNVADVTAVPSISGTGTCREAIAGLFSSDWGRSPKSLKDVVNAMKLNGIYYPNDNVSVELLRMTKLGLLRRLKEGNGFKYVSAKNLICQ